MWNFRVTTAVALLVAGLAQGASAREAVTPSSFEIVADPTPSVPLEIKRGSGRVRVNLQIAGALLLNSPLAERARLKAFPIIGKQTVKGNLLPGGSAIVRGNRYTVKMGGLPEKAIIAGWIDKPVVEGWDGVIGIYDLNADRVAIVQPSAPAGGRVYTLPWRKKDEPVGETVIGAETVNIVLDLESPETVMSAVTAQALLSGGAVVRSGAVALWNPVPQVTLPFERLTPRPGATVAGLPLIKPAARITEARAKELDAMAKAGTSTAEQEQDAIVVTAKKRGKQREPWIMIGRDVLGYCSRIELDKPAQRWLLTCNFPAA